MKSTETKLLRYVSPGQEILAGGLVIVLLLVLAASWYGYTRITTLSTQVSDLTSALASTTVTIANATTTLAEALKQQEQNVQSQLGDVQDRVGSVSDTVGDLQKLSTIDSQLLAKYSKVFFLSDTYAPARLVEIPPKYAYLETNALQVIPEILPFLEEMLSDAKDDGIDMYISSAYRSFNTQSALKGQYKVTYGAGTANSFSADQGYSEHQLGTTLDLITTGTGGALEGFDKKPAYQWMVQNGYKYGFVQSYPPNNGFYIYEPWHWRFVGVKLATKLHRSETFFYQMDQRTIDTYLISLFD
jgi:LAS superfamily LD-carboxypeptidase LdcB